MDGRPLSQGREALARLWRERGGPLRPPPADAEIENGASPEDCARAVEEAYHEAVCD